MALRLFESTHSSIPHNLNGLLLPHCRQSQSVSCEGGKRPRFASETVTHADDLNRQQALLQLMMGGQVSRTTGLKSIGQETSAKRCSGPWTISASRPSSRTSSKRKWARPRRWLRWSPGRVLVGSQVASKGNHNKEVGRWIHRRAEPVARGALVRGSQPAVGQGRAGHSGRDAVSSPIYCHTAHGHAGKSEGF